jgi:hypothetical protein
MAKRSDRQMLHRQDDAGWCELQWYMSLELMDNYAVHKRTIAYDLVIASW